MNNFKCSIVIATYNRSQLLKETLESLATNLDSKIVNELIIVNNNSDDDTQIVANSFMGRFPFYRVYFEAEQGLSYARNRGVKESEGEIIVFLDDDVEIDHKWLIELLQPFCEKEVGVVGGKVLPFGHTEFPKWLPREYGYLTSVFDPSDLVCDVEKVMGANFAVRRNVFNEVGVFNVNLGRKGKKLLGGEEVELFQRINRAGYKIIFTPHSRVWHKIAEKLQKTYIEDYAYWLGVSEAAIDRNMDSCTKYVLKLVRSIIFPWTVYLLERTIGLNDLAAPMRYAIKRNYARGYLGHSIKNYVDSGH